MATAYSAVTCHPICFMPVRPLSVFRQGPNDPNWIQLSQVQLQIESTITRSPAVWDRPDSRVKEGSQNVVSTCGEFTTAVICNCAENSKCKGIILQSKKKQYLIWTDVCGVVVFSIVLYHKNVILSKVLVMLYANPDPISSDLDYTFPWEFAQKAKKSYWLLVLYTAWLFLTNGQEGRRAWRPL